MKILKTSAQTISVPINGISDTGKDIVNEFLKDNGFPALPGYWSWDWVVMGTGEYVGSFTKRVQKYYKKVRGIKLTPGVVSTIGTLAMDHVNTQKEYTFDIVDKFNWSAGDFGDEGSCFWSCHASAKETLLEADCLAIRLFKETGSPVGYARAWLMPISVHGVTCHVLFNSYGIDKFCMARILSQHAEFLYYKGISLKNQGSTAGHLWINSGRGVLVGPRDVIIDVDSHDFYLKDTGSVCSVCEESVCSEDSFTAPNDTIMCEACFEDNVVMCDHCSAWSMLENSVLKDDSWFCETCYEDLYAECAICNNDTLERNAVSHNDKCFCEDCFNETYSYCEECCEYFPNNEVNEAGTMCLECEKEEEAKEAIRFEKETA